MGLNKRELELAAVSISIAAGCIPCTRYHIAQVELHGISHEEVIDAVRVGVIVSDIATKRMWKLFDRNPSRISLDSSGLDKEITDKRQSVLGAIGSAVAKNDGQQLQSYLNVASLTDITDAQIMEIMGVANRIKEKASSHLKPFVANLDANPALAEEAATLCR